MIADDRVDIDDACRADVVVELVVVAREAGVEVGRRHKRWLKATQTELACARRARRTVEQTNGKKLTAFMFRTALLLYSVVFISKRAVSGKTRHESKKNAVMQKREKGT